METIGVLSYERFKPFELSIVESGKGSPDGDVRRRKLEV
jgi:hypothetical protein